MVDRLARSAEMCSWDASVLTTSLMCKDDGRALAAALGARFEAEVLPIDRPRILGYSSRANAAMDAAVRNADMVHVHTLWNPLNTMARRACERHGKPYVLSPHGMLDPYSVSVRAWRKRAYLALIERWNLEAAARVVFASISERDVSRTVAGAFSLGEVVSLGADEPPPIPREELATKFLEQYPGGVDGRRILFLSRLHPKKGLERLLDAMPEVVRRHPRAHLFIAGSGESGYEADLRTRAQKLGVASDVTFTGFLSGRSKWSAMAAADVFVLPSYHENFGISVAEAMHAELPVIVSRQVNIASEIAAAGAGIVLKDADDARSLAHAIGQLLDDPVARRRIGENARNLALGRYGWPDAAKRCFALYDAVLGEIGAGRSDPAGPGRLCDGMDI